MSSDDDWDEAWDDEDDGEDLEWESAWDDDAPDADGDDRDGEADDRSTGPGASDAPGGTDDAEAESVAVDDADGGDDGDAADDDDFAEDDGFGGGGDADVGEDEAFGGGGEDDFGEAGDGEMFEESFAAALDDAPSLDEEGGAEMDDADVGVGSGEFDVGGADFGGGGDFGMGGGVGGDADFENEDFESDIPRIDVGIEGLDEMIQGGVPERSLMVAIGSAGTGKTTFGLQFLDHALRQGERAIYVTLEENRDRIVNSATEKGMAFDEYAADGQLAIVDFDPVEMAHSLGSIRSELPDLIREFGATRLVLDSVSLLEMMYDDRARRRNEIYDFTESLKHAGVTTMLTSEASQTDPYASRHGIVEYLTDAVFVLQYVRPDDFRETRLAVEIQKIRDANHSRETKPYEITDEGIDVYRQANIF